VTRAFGILGIVGIGAAAGAILGAADVDAWIVGIVVSCVTLVLGAVLRRSLDPARPASGPTRSPG